MGTTLQIIAVEPCGVGKLRTLLPQAQRLLDRYEKSLSLYQSESEIRRLNRQGFLEHPSPEFLETLASGLKHAELTHGTFDPTVRSVMRAIEARRPGELNNKLAAQLRRRFRHLINYRRVRYTASRVWFEKPGVEVTFDGSAKGLAADRVADLLQRNGFDHFVVNFSGNMKIRGSDLDGQRWRVAIDDPKGGEIVFQKPVEAISTSAPTFNHYTPDRRWHHLIDPKLAGPSRRYLQATVIGPSAEVCDILSTAAFVGNRSAVQRIFRNYPDYDYWLFLPDGSIVTR